MAKMYGAVLQALTDLASEGEVTEARLDDVARRAQVCTRTVTRAVAALEADGHLTVRRGVGRGHRSRYTLAPR